MVPQKNPGVWGRAPSVARGTITKSTMAMEPKHDHSVEIYEKSPDMNLEIPYDVNLEFNRKPPVEKPLAVSGMSAAELNTKSRGRRVTVIV